MSGNERFLPFGFVPKGLKSGNPRASFFFAFSSSDPDFTITQFNFERKVMPFLLLESLDESNLLQVEIVTRHLFAVAALEEEDLAVVLCDHPPLVPPPKAPGHADLPFFRYILVLELPVFYGQPLLFLLFWIFTSMDVLLRLLIC